MSMAETIPAWLISGFARACANLGASASREAEEQQARDLATVWSAPERCFHNLTHLKDTLENVDFLAEQARDIDALHLAVWFHGAVFDVSEAAVERSEGGINIMESAKLAQNRLTFLGLPPEKVDTIVALIESLYRHKATEDIDSQVLCDADLAILSADPEEYLDYLQAIREEYRAYSNERFVETRLEIVESLLARPQLFYTHTAATWEEQARENLLAEQSRLHKVNVSELPPPPEPSASTLPAPGLDSGSFEVISEADEEEDSKIAGDINPYAPTDEADLGSTLENVEEVMDTLVMKALKSDEMTIKPMSDNAQ